ncbi:MAG: peptidase prolyl oligopeptidase active site domain protein [Verrucomicrobia bacterium]|nr:peptidase prolyl oligopeptidase active site domain protein [Verrucomicrobiota bacterium]
MNLTRVFGFRIALLLSTLLGGNLIHGAEAPIPASAFFSLPSVRAPRVSPDGKKIAFLFPNEGRMALGLFDRATKEARIILKGTDESIFSFFWKGNDRIVFSADFQGNESFFIGSTDLSGKKIIRIVETQPEEGLAGSAGGILDELHFDPERIIVAGVLRASAQRPGETSLQEVPMSLEAVVARVNVRNRGISPLFTYERTENTRSVGVDNAGTVRLRSRIEKGHTVVWETRVADDKPWRVMARHPFNGYVETWNPQFFGADNVTLYLVSYEEQDRGALYTYNTRTLERSAALFVPPEGEISGVIMSPDRKELRGVAYTSDRTHYHWFDAARGALQQRLENTFSGSSVTITSSSDDETVKLVFVSHDREPGVYFLLDEKAGSLASFKRVREIDPALLSPRRPVSYRARDGLEINGYLTVPRGHEGRRVPLVMLPHGGPFGIREEWGYDAESQFLASRGYAVLQPNYRGSGGYGREFLNKGRQQWGRAMQDDLTDGVKWAIDQGFADPNRIAIYGASYGGYAALAGVTLTPELYRCAVNYVGAADLEITYKNRGDDAFTTSEDFNYQREWIGPTAEYRAATSPLNYVERIRVPTLHAYGKRDPRVKIDHWQRLEPLLRKYGKSYESIEQSHQGHGFRDEKASIAFYERMDQFFAKYLAPESNPGVRIGEPKVIELPAKP